MEPSGSSGAVVLVMSSSILPFKTGRRGWKALVERWFAVDGQTDVLGRPK